MSDGMYFLNLRYDNPPMGNEKSIPMSNQSDRVGGNLADKIVAFGTTHHKLLEKITKFYFY